MSVIAFAEGDRVRVKADRADGYRQPWRDRFKKGRAGTVRGFKDGIGLHLRVKVLWDHNKRGNDLDFTIELNARDLELAE